MSSVTNGVDGVHGKRGRILRRRSPLRLSRFRRVRNRRRPLLQKNRIGRRGLDPVICSMQRLRSQIATQNLNASSRDDGETENEFFHAPRVSGRLAVCLSGRIPEFLAWPLSDFALQNGCNLG